MVVGPDAVGRWKAAVGRWKAAVGLWKDAVGRGKQKIFQFISHGHAGKARKREQRKSITGKPAPNERKLLGRGAHLGM